jgi:hypothetical protein
MLQKLQGKVAIKTQTQRKERRKKLERFRDGKAKNKQIHKKTEKAKKYSKTSFLVQIKFITKEKHQTHIIILILN